MTIVARTVPNAITSVAMSEALAARSARLAGQPPVPFDLGGSAAQVAAAPPLPVYTIPIAALAEERPTQIEDATQQGWRVLTTDSQGAQLVDVVSATGAPVSVSRGASTELLAAAGELAQNECDATATYEPRIVDFGRLGLSALWLQSAEAPDLFYRLDGPPEQTTIEAFLHEATLRARRYLQTFRPAGPDRDGAPGDLGG